MSVSGSPGPTPLATVKGVIQRADRPGTGTIFLLNDQGVTVIRSLAAKEEHQTEIWEKEGNWLVDAGLSVSKTQIAVALEGQNHLLIPNTVRVRRLEDFSVSSYRMKGYPAREQAL